MGTVEKVYSFTLRGWCAKAVQLKHAQELRHTENWALGLHPGRKAMVAMLF